MEPQNNHDRQIGVSRLLKASPERVWSAWTRPEEIAQWWGPEGFTNTIEQMDLRAGGEWRLLMQGPDGKRYPNRSVFTEIATQERFCFRHFNPDYEATVTFTPQGAHTLMEWHMLFETAALFETVVKVFKADEGLQQNADKLERYLADKYHK